MTNHSLINADGKTHAKIAFLALAVSAVFMALISASSVTKSDVRVAGPVIKANAIVKVAASDRGVIR